MTTTFPLNRRALSLLIALTLLAGACGGGGSAGGPTSEQSEAAIAAAAQNEPQLTLINDLAASELLNTADGSITSLAEQITGDRPVLLWFWAPH